MDTSPIADGESIDDLTSDEPLKVGSTVDGCYVVVALLALGKTFAIYKVEHVLLKRIFALKTLAAAKPSKDEFRYFQDQARLAHKLAHPNFPHVHSVGITDEDRPFLIMDLVEGQDLHQYAKHIGTLTVDAVLHIFIPICYALDSALASGVVFRGLKPSSIVLVKPEGKTEYSPRIIDFTALAEIDSMDNSASEKVSAEELLKCSLYASPEESEGKETDCRSAIYSLACVMYEVLTGAPPFHGETAHAVMLKHRSQEPTSLKEASMGRDYPLQLEEVVARALAKAPQDRYQSFIDLANDLQAVRQPGRFRKTVAMAIPSPEPEQRVESVAVPDSQTNWKLIAMVISTNVFSIAATCFLMTHFLHQDTSSEKLSSEVHDYISDVATSRAMFMSVSGTGDSRRRTFHFPAVSLGKFSYFDASKASWVDMNALGTVVVPINCLTKFETEDRIIAERPNTLRLFGPTDITHLTINPTKIGNYEDNVAPIVDAAMAYVARYTSLAQLVLNGIPVTDVGVRSLQELPNLIAIDLGGSKASAASIRQLKNFKLLTMLRMGGVRDGKKLIPDCLTNQNLRVFSLANSDLEDSDLESLGKMPLHSLDIAGNFKVTDRGIHFLAANTQLIDLDLIGASLTPACTDDLAKFKSLRGLRLSVQNWTKADVQKLVSLLPKDCLLIAALPGGRGGYRGIDWQKELK